MPRSKLLTSATLDQIETWLNEGLCAAAIAEKIGCTLGTLRVRCSQYGISLRRKKSPGAAVGCSSHPASQTRGDLPTKLLRIHMAKPTVNNLRSRAAQKGISESTLAVVLLESIVRDDLFEAVLDEDSTESALAQQNGTNQNITCLLRGTHIKTITAFSTESESRE